MERPFASIHELLGPSAFGPGALARLQAAAAVSPRTRSRIGERIAWRDPRRRADFPWLPHATGAVNAWALLVLPGPGKDEDPWEMSYDWSPGWGEPARHLAHFPNYTENTVSRAGHSWTAIRRILRETPIPGFRREVDRLASWGVANLTAQHSRDEQAPVIDRHDVRLMRAHWILGTCRPVVVAVSPGQRNRDNDVVAAALLDLGLEPTGIVSTWEWTHSGARTYRLTAQMWRCDEWSTGLIRLNQHPQKWNSFGNPIGLADALRWIGRRTLRSASKLSK